MGALGTILVIAGAIAAIVGGVWIIVLYIGIAVAATAN